MSLLIGMASAFFAGSKGAAPWPGVWGGGPPHRNTYYHNVHLIPLKTPNPDVTIDLQMVLNRCYDNGGYDDFIDYRRPPHAPVTPEEQFWMNAMLEQGGEKEA